MAGIPNTFQTFNDYVDQAMELLSGEEYKCLSFACRHILGWQEKINKRRGSISITMFEQGFTTEAGKRFGGTGLTRGAIIKALGELVRFGLLNKVGDADADGQEYELGITPNWELMQERHATRQENNRKRTQKATATRKANQAGTSDVLVRGTYQERYVGRTQTNSLQSSFTTPPPQPPVEVDDPTVPTRKQYPVFYTVGMKYKDGLSIDPLQFIMDVNAIFYAYLDTLKDVGREKAAMYDYLWQEHREDCKNLALARVTPDDVRDYIKSRYDPTIKTNQFWISQDEGMPLKNVVKGIAAFIARKSKAVITTATLSDADRQREERNKARAAELAAAREENIA